MSEDIENIMTERFGKDTVIALATVENYIEQNLILRERIIRFWFDMWLAKKDSGISDVFSDNAVYIESWGARVPRFQKNKTLV